MPPSRGHDDVCLVAARPAAADALRPRQPPVHPRPLSRLGRAHSSTCHGRAKENESRDGAGEVSFCINAKKWEDNVLTVKFRILPILATFTLRIRQFRFSFQTFRVSQKREQGRICLLPGAELNLKLHLKTIFRITENVNMKFC